MAIFVSCCRLVLCLCRLQFDAGVSSWQMWSVRSWPLILLALHFSAVSSFLARQLIPFRTAVLFYWQFLLSTAMVFLVLFGFHSNSFHSNWLFSFNGSMVVFFYCHVVLCHSQCVCDWKYAFIYYHYFFSAWAFSQFSSFPINVCTCNFQHYKAVVLRSIYVTDRESK